MGFRVAIVEFIHESNTFTVMRTGMSDFRASHYFTGPEIPQHFTGTGSEVGGAIDEATELGWEPMYIVAAHAEPGGPVTEAARSAITMECERRLQVAGSLDGLFVALHGAMVTETDRDGDRQFMQAIRSVVDATVPIAVTLDLHANVSDEFSGLVDIAVSYRTYPHVDMKSVGVEACHLLHQAMHGEIEPAIAICRPPMLVGCDDGRTTDNGPMCRLLESAEQNRIAEGVLNVAVNAGFTDADVYEAGPSVLVTYDRKRISHGSASSIAERMCDEICQYRHEWSQPLSLADCIDQLRSIEPSDQPIVIADFADNPGSGAYSDCTALITALLDVGIQNAAAGALYDPEAVSVLCKKGVGEKVTLSIGGKIDPDVGGGPLEVTGEVMSISDGTFVFEGPMFTGLPGTTGLSVCFRVDGLDIMIVSERMQMLDRNIFRVVGIEPLEKSFLIVKSMQHFKGAFAPIASRILVTDAGGLSSPDVTARNYRHVRRPVFPLDMIN